MNMQYADILADGLFATKVVKTIKNETFTSDTKRILKQIIAQMDNSISGKQASQNFNTDQDTLQTLRAYGKSISVVESLNVEDAIDCVEKYVKEIINEVKTALETENISIKSMPKTFDYYRQQQNSSIEQGSRFNMNVRKHDMWQTVTKF